jgi:hypothetical protein
VDPLRVGVMQDFNRVAVEDGDHGPVKSAMDREGLNRNKREQSTRTHPLYDEPELSELRCCTVPPFLGITL